MMMAGKPNFDAYAPIRSRRGKCAAFAGTVLIWMTATLTAAVPSSADEADGSATQTLTTAGYVLDDGSHGSVVLDTQGQSAQVPGNAPMVVSVGDSYISGEAGRWGGNSDQAAWSEYSDAGSQDAYQDIPGAEAVPGCHRSKSAEIHIGHGVTSVNLACSGAQTTTYADRTPYKPGVDFTSDTLSSGVHRQGQALMLQHLAAANPGRIKMVNLSIGGNDFGFGAVVQDCVQGYLVPGVKIYCSDKPELQALFGPANVEARTTDIARAIADVGTAMLDAGYQPTDWNLVIQTYPSPLPPGNIRYKEFAWERQYLGGCGLYDKDLIWANNTALQTINDAVRAAAVRTTMPNIKILDLSDAYVGHRLCEKNVNIVGPLDWYPVYGYVWSPVRRWTQSNAVDLSEWVSQVRLTSLVLPPYELQESMHPNYWGQLALRNCVMQAWNGGTVRGGDCVYGGTGLDANGWPRMALADTDGWENGQVVPFTGAEGAAVPTSVRLLKVKSRSNGVATASWKSPKAGQVTTYLYRLREVGQPWGAWVSNGVSRSVTLSVLEPGKKYRVSVMAHSPSGSGSANGQTFRIPK